MSTPGTAATPDPFRRNVLLLWWGQLVSATGDALFVPCIGWLAAEVTGQKFTVGLAMAATALPVLLFAPLAGAWADRGDRRRILIASDLARAGLLFGFVLAVEAGLPLTLATLLVVAFLLGAFSTPFVPARDALLPSIVGPRSLARWNAAFQTSATTAALAGLLLGGLLLASGLGGSDSVDRVLAVIAADGVTFLVSAAALFALVLPRHPRVQRHATSLWADVKSGWREARGDKLILGLLLLTAANNLALMGPAYVGPVLLLKDELGLGPQHLVWFEAAMALGMLLGGLLLARFGKNLPLGRLLMIALVLDGITYLPFVWLDHYGALVVMILLHGLFIPAIVVARTTLLQAHVPDGRRGKVFALVHVTVTGMTALSCLGAGALAEAAGVRSLFAVTGVLATASGIVGYLLLARDLDQVRRMPETLS
ncbi:MAG: MFS transporter [Planctomycetota bacterium]